MKMCICIINKVIFIVILQGALVTVIRMCVCMDVWMYVCACMFIISKARMMSLAARCMRVFRMLVKNSLD